MNKSRIRLRHGDPTLGGAWAPPHGQVAPNPQRVHRLRASLSTLGYNPGAQLAQPDRGPTHPPRRLPDAPAPA